MKEEIKATKEKIERSKKISLIPTEDPNKFIANKKYDVEVKSGSEYSCTCPDFKANHGFPCKHIIAAAFEKKMEVKEDKSGLDTIEKRYNTWEVASALQKEIRHGKVKEAAWWAFCLLRLAGIYMFWRRMYIIAVEDCTAPAITIVENCKKGFDWVRGKKDWKKPSSGDEILFGIKAAVELARLEKDRTADDLSCYFQDLEEKRLFAKNDKFLDIPDYACDGRTRKNKKRGDLFFWQEGSNLVNPSPDYDTEIKEKYIKYFSENKK